eukprot:366399-Chlamydomonas_euryale.AAC.2
MRRRGGVPPTARAAAAVLVAARRRRAHALKRVAGSTCCAAERTYAWHVHVQPLCMGNSHGMHAPAAASARRARGTLAKATTEDMEQIAGTPYHASALGCGARSVRFADDGEPGARPTATAGPTHPAYCSSVGGRAPIRCDRVPEHRSTQMRTRTRSERRGTDASPATAATARCDRKRLKRPGERPSRSGALLESSTQLARRVAWHGAGCWPAGHDGCSCNSCTGCTRDITPPSYSLQPPSPYQHAQAATRKSALAAEMLGASHAPGTSASVLMSRTHARRSRTACCPVRTP